MGGLVADRGNARRLLLLYTSSTPAPLVLGGVLAMAPQLPAADRLRTRRRIDRRLARRATRCCRRASGNLPRGPWRSRPRCSSWPADRHRLRWQADRIAPCHSCSAMPLSCWSAPIAVWRLPDPPAASSRPASELLAQHCGRHRRGRRSRAALAGAAAQLRHRVFYVGPFMPCCPLVVRDIITAAPPRSPT